MTRPRDQLDLAAAIASELRNLGLSPVLVGGMALTILGSRRVTQDFDFLVVHPADRLQHVVDAFYDRGFELVSKLDEAGEVRATLDNRKIAGIRLRLDEPATAYFFNSRAELRIDLLFDFPKPASELAARGTHMKIAGHVFTLASEQDLLELKRIAKKARSFAGDAQDIQFLEERLRI